MLVRFKNHIEKTFSFVQNKKILIAVSGGIDSTVLTHLLHQLNFEISIAHCNFKLRGINSDNDEEFVKTLGEKLQIPTYTTSFNTLKIASKKGISTQMAARELRYHWFYRLLESHNLHYIATAHQKEDVLETFLLNAVRGTGLAGLTGIPKVNHKTIRPLLPFSRKEIEQFAIKNHIEWREDKSNASVKYKRNKIRHQIIPILQKINPNLLDSFSKTIENLQGSQHIINDTIGRLQSKITTKKGEEFYISISEIQKLENPKAYLFELLKKYNFTEWNDVENMLNAQTGKQLLSTSHRLLKNREYFIISKNKPQQQQTFCIAKDTKKITTPVLLKFEFTSLSFEGKGVNNAFSEWLKSPNTMLFDASKLTFPLTLRKWEKGDYFYPIGLNGKKKVSKFFKDEKISRFEKEKIWLLCSDHKIVWVVGYRMDDRFKVTEKTNEIFKVKVY